MSSERFLGGLLVGGALGIVIGMMIAPRSGRETRDMIQDEFEGRLNQAKDEVRYRASEMSDRARETADNLKGRAQEKVDELRSRATEIAEDLEQIGRDTMDKVRTSVKTKPNQ